MPTFLYKGIDAEGYIKSGAKKYAGTAEMEKHLEGIGLTDFQVYESKTLYKSGNYALVSPKELSIFCKQMSILFFSHMTLIEGLQLLTDQIDNKQLKTALGEIYMFMEGGFTFSEAASMYTHIFSSYLLNMITIGETSGNLDSVFDRMSNYYDKEYRIRKKLRTAMTYPLMLTALMFAIVLLLIVRVLPMFNSILMDMGSELPVGTMAILGVGEFMSKYLWVFIAVIILIIVGIRFYKKTDKGSYFFNKLAAKTPVVQFLTHRIASSRIARSLAMLLKSGVSLINALEEVVPLLDNKYLEEKLKKAVVELRDGGEFIDVIDQMGIFPPLFVRMSAIGQNTGHLDEMMLKSADVFDEETDDAVERLTNMVEPILIIILSIIVGIILLSVMLPMIDIMTIIG